MRLVDGEERRVHPRHLPRADPDRRLAFGEEDRVRLDRRHGGPGEPQIAPFYPGRFPFGHDLPRRLRGLAARVEAVLHEEAAADALEVPGGLRRGAGELDHPQVLLLAIDRERVVVIAWGDDHFDE